MITGNIKRRFYLLVLIGVLVGCMCLAPVIGVLADTTFPEEFHGDVTVNGAPAAVGAKITAKIGGVERGSFTITEAGKYGGTGTFDERLIVYGDEGDIGQEITFWISDTRASETAVYEPGESKELDLTVNQAYTYPLSADNGWITCALNYLRGAQGGDGSIGGLGTSAWVVMAICAAGEDPDDWKAGANSIIDYLRNSSGSLGDIATDWARSILAITAAGENPRDFGGVDYVGRLKGYYNNNQIGSVNLLNDDFWGVLALISAGESQSSAIITDSVNFIKDNQDVTDHGWSHGVGGASGSDNTAAAVMALIAGGEDAGSEVILNALAYLKTQQQNSGGFQSEGSTNSAVDSWVINAIVATGQSPTGGNWVKNGNNPVGHLLSLQIADCSFNWTVSLRSNPEWLTAYAIPALLGQSYPNYTSPKVDIWVVLQGSSRLDPEGWEVPITVKFFSPGADVLNDTPIEEFSLTTTKSNSVATCQCTGVTPGTYDITVVSEHTLMNVREDVAIFAPSTAVDMCALIEGDANNNGTINIQDFGILSVSFMKSEGQDGYDARADFDCNGIINIADFGLLSVNFMKTSPVVITP